MPILWFIGKPILVSAVSDAMAEEIEDQVKAGVAPLNGAFIAIIQNNIDNLIREIARMEFRRDNPPAGDWVSEDSQDLAQRRIDLSAQEAALEALQENSTG